MNKQQLAAKIWESANRMRSRIEANEYKDYILGFIFYKYLSDKEKQWLLAREYTEEDIREYVNEEDEETGLSKLGENTKSQTKAVSDLIQLIDEIPMNGKQDYDVLGFIYEYLISNFAENAGKKAGEFYTPHEVSLLMSEIVANHLKGREEIKIYETTLIWTFLKSCFHWADWVFSVVLSHSLHILSCMS